jgi:hypothetical protein
MKDEGWNFIFFPSSFILHPSSFFLRPGIFSLSSDIEDKESALAAASRNCNRAMGEAQAAGRAGHA